MKRLTSKQSERHLQKFQTMSSDEKATKGNLRDNSHPLSVGVLPPFPLFGGLMKRAFCWFTIIFLLLLTVRLLMAQTFQKVSGNTCYPAEVLWQIDSVKVASYGCVDFNRKVDTLIIVPHIVDGEARNSILVPKEQVKKVTLYQEKQSATFKSQNGN
jgi:hypothetical protein